MSRIVHSFISQKSFLISLAGVATFSAFAALTSIAQAESSKGSLALSDLTELINQSPKLKQEVQQALKDVKKDDVGCVAPLFRRSFDPLNNSRIAPFTCLFAKNKSLTIEAETVAKLSDGETISLEQLLDRKDIPEGVSLQFELTSWKWTNASY